MFFVTKIGFTNVTTQKQSTSVTQNKFYQLYSKLVLQALLDISSTNVAQNKSANGI